MVRKASLCRIVTFSQKVRSGDTVRSEVLGCANTCGYCSAAKGVIVASCVGVQAANAPISSRMIGRMAPSEKRRGYAKQTVCGSAGSMLI